MESLNWQRQLIDEAAITAGCDPASIATNVRINPAHGARVGDVADVVRRLADHGYDDAYVGLMYVADSAAEMLEWV